MLDDPGERHPDVTVDIALVGGAGRGVVMEAGAFDARAVALGGRIVQGEQPAWPGVDGTAEVAEPDGGEGINLAAADGSQQGVGAAEVVGNAPGPEPGGGGAPAVGQEEADEQGWEQFGMTPVEQPVQDVDEFLQGWRDWRGGGDNIVGPSVHR